MSRGRFKSVVKFFENVGIAGSEEAENENVNKSRNGVREAFKNVLADFAR